MPDELTPALARQITEEEGLYFDESASVPFGIKRGTGVVRISACGKEFIITLNTGHLYDRFTPASLRELLRSAKGEKP
jgi:hypothetical protein